MKVGSLTILGSTGSIGRQALEVARKLGIRITAMSAHKNIKLFEEQLREFRPAIAAVSDEPSAAALKPRIADLNIRLYAGEEGLCAAAGAETDMVLNAIVGMAGLRPTLAAIDAGRPVALANKESLVTGGALVMEKAKKSGVPILPVDSEHSAVFQCLQGCADKAGEIERIILTASGGPFFGMSRGRLSQVTPSQALRHPNWNMGRKITIDSATLMNKGMEFIEAMWLFDVRPEQIQVVIHRESILHSAVEFKDHSVIAQLGVPDMRIPIQYALTYPHRYASPAKPLDLFELGRLTFERPDMETFKCLKVCLEAARRGGLVPAAVNGADEEAVALFLENRIGFNDIGDLVEAAAKSQDEKLPVTLEGIIKADVSARALVRASVGP